VPLAYNNSGIVPHFDVNEIAYGSVMSGINGDERRLPSELDIVTDAQVSGFTILGLNPQQTSQFDQIETASQMRSKPRLESSNTSGFKH